MFQRDNTVAQPSAPMELWLQRLNYTKSCIVDVVFSFETVW